MDIFLIKSVLLECVLMFYKILEQLTVVLFRGKLFTCFCESTCHRIILTCGPEISRNRLRIIHLRGFFLHPIKGGHYSSQKPLKLQHETKHETMNNRFQRIFAASSEGRTAMYITSLYASFLLLFLSLFTKICFPIKLRTPYKVFLTSCK
jgi:hypothetical protein